MDPFSRRTRVIAAENSLTQVLAHARAQALPLLDLSVSNPTAVGLSLGPSALNLALSDPHNARYAPEPFGLYGARKALSERVAHRGHAVAPEHIMLTASTSEAYAHLFKLLCDPGDAVLVPAPSYPLLEVLATLEHVRLVPYRLQYDGEWHLEHSLVELAHQSQARAIVTVHPNNPTGSFIKRDELEILAATHLPIVSDEVFADYTLVPDARRAATLLELNDRLVFCMGGLSKALALPQLKLAWTLMQGPAALLTEARVRLEHIADAYLSCATPVQHALPRLLNHAGALQATLGNRCRANLTFLQQACDARQACNVLRVEGGWVAIMRLPNTLDEEQWALELVTRDRVVTQPGYFYELGTGAHVVLSLITPEPTFREGVARIIARVRAST